MIYEYNYKVGIDDLDKYGNMSNRSIISLLEKVFSFKADECHLGINDMLNNNITCFLIDWYINVINRPKYSNELIVKTWIRKYENNYFYCDFEIFLNNKVIINVTSKWGLIDIKTKSLVPITESFISKMGDINKKSLFTFELSKMTLLDNYSNSIKINIRKSDLDFNNHVNNVKYFDYIKELGSDKEYNNIRITYRKEIKYDDEIYLYYQKIDNNNYYVIKDSNDIVKTIIECS